MYLIPIARLRVKFYSFAALAVAGVAIDAPAWSVAASILLCAAIPLAVALQSPERLRALFLPERAANAAAPSREVSHHAKSR